MLCYSSSLPKALHLAAEVEILAKQYNVPFAFGEPTLLSDAEMDVILAKFKTYGKQLEDLAGMCCFDQEHAVAIGGCCPTLFLFCLIFFTLCSILKVSFPFLSNFVFNTSIN